MAYEDSAYPYILHGDVGSAIIALLQDDPTIAALDPAPVITKNLIDFDEFDRWIMVTPEGGFDSFAKEEPRVDIDCYGQDINDALDLARFSKAAIYASQGLKLADGVFLLRVRTDIGLTQLQDKETDTPRYFMSLRLDIAPTAPV